MSTLTEIRSLSMELVSRLPIFAKIVTHAKQQKRESKDITVVLKVLKSELRSFQQIHSDLLNAVEARRLSEHAAEQRALIDYKSIAELKTATDNYASIASNIGQRLIKLSELTDALAG